ncbi:Ycf66 family protein [Gloeothece verrucosa]|uniref:Ycf66 family protein n=1 Tax=Gloeothece verrucosa (strain PCC 7822) TaxID=497965 RepID=E0U7H6_GLOV7|nr:Ycf66 family protein [Gloeothece verrucosa]ADN13672.1 Ycf66 family protein [Gloeothece verrucosa PCC 7822]
MVNFGLNSASILGIFLAVAGAGLYFLRSVRPELSRDHDIFFAAVGLLCGLILLFQGWRLDPILQFGQFLLTGSTIFFAVETIRLRGVATEQARRSGPIVEDRPVSDAYTYSYQQEAELEALEPYDEERYANRQRLKGTDYRGSSRGGYEEEPRTSRTRRPGGSNTDPYNSPKTSRVRRPRSSSSPTYDPYDDWSEGSETREKRPPSSRPSRRPSGVEPPQTANKPPRRRPSRPPTDDIYSMKDADAASAEYVDYQPLDEKSEDNSQWDTESQSERNPRRDYNDTESQSERPRNRDYNDTESQSERNPRRDYNDTESQSERPRNRDYNEDNPSRFDY